MVPVAPALLSTMNDWPSVLLSDGPMARAMASVDPPGGNGTTRVTGLFGQACACTPDTAANAKRRIVRSFFMGGASESRQGAAGPAWCSIGGGQRRRGPGRAPSNDACMVALPKGIVQETRGGF